MRWLVDPVGPHCKKLTELNRILMVRIVTIYLSRCGYSGDRIDVIEIH